MGAMEEGRRISKLINQRDVRERSLSMLNRRHCEQLIEKEIVRLASHSDFVVYVLYDRENGEEPLEYNLFRLAEGKAKLSDIPYSLDLEGIVVWYFCNRQGDNFTCHKILIELEDGIYKAGQYGHFEGFWDEFSQYVANDRWVASALQRG